MSTKPNRHYEFPWRSGNRVELLIDSAQFYSAMLNSINSSQSSILLEIYLIESGHTASLFIDALVEAKARGVHVHLLFDHFGSLGLNKRDRHRIRLAKIPLVLYNQVRYGSLRRSLFRDHRKLLIVDQQVAYLGGAGITDEFSGDRGRQWRETMIHLVGPCVQDWVGLFKSVWDDWSKIKLELDSLVSGVESDSGCVGRATCTHGRGHQEIKASLVKRIRAAERCIFLATAYFVPSWKIRRALISASKRGVEVRLLLPGPHTDHPAVRHAGRRFYLRLLKAGVKVYEYEPRFMHQKVLLCDNWVSIGSSNIDRWNFRWNLEANQEVESEAFASEVKAMLDRDLLESKEIPLANWLRRAWHRRVLEWFWGKIDILLDRWTRP